MMLDVTILIVAVCLGVLLSSTRVPRLRPVPLVASVLLVLAWAVGIVALVPDHAVLGSIAAVLFIISAVVYGAIVWRRVLGKEQLSFATAIWYGIVGPSQLRARYKGMREETCSESSLQP